MNHRPSTPSDDAEKNASGHPRSLKELRREAESLNDQHLKVAGHTTSKADVYKFVGLIAFLLIALATCGFLWPYISDIFQPGGIDRVIRDVRGAGPAGVLILFALQFLQIVVAFIPGEVTQVAAGLLYGPFWGSLLILLGCFVSSGFVYFLVHHLGAPFVQSMVPKKHLDSFERLEETGRLESLVFILFLIPGLPKDVFTYIVPLTNMPLGRFLLITTVGRAPGVFVSAYAASGLMEGKMVESVLIFLVVGALALAGIASHKKIVAWMEKRFSDKREGGDGDAAVKPASSDDASAATGTDAAADASAEAADADTAAGDDAAADATAVDDDPTGGATR